jgi:hypothetical protein
MTGGGRSSQPPYRKAVTRSMIRAKVDRLACGSAAASGRGLGRTRLSDSKRDRVGARRLGLAGIERWTLIDHPKPSSITLPASDFSGHNAIRKTRRSKRQISIDDSRALMSEINLSACGYQLDVKSSNSIFAAGQLPVAIPSTSPACSREANNRARSWGSCAGLWVASPFISEIPLTARFKLRHYQSPATGGCRRAVPRSHPGDRALEARDHPVHVRLMREPRKLRDVGQRQIAIDE